VGATTRQPPREFEAELRRRWPDFRRIEWDELFGRWRFFFTSAAGRESSWLYMWDRDPRTGAPAEVDPLSGLRPFRELDAQAQSEIIFHGERTALTNLHDGEGDWKRRGGKIVEDQKAAHAKRRRNQAEDYAYALQQVDLRRPWVKDHKLAPRGKGKKFGAHMHAPPQVNAYMTASGLLVCESFGAGARERRQATQPKQESAA
jgi:hypothetical protein